MADDPINRGERAQLDMFVADIMDVSPKGDVVSMENPVFALSTKPDTEIYRFEQGEVFVEVAPSTHGRPTIFDKDFLMYCISQVVEGLNRGRAISKNIKVTAYDFLKATSRGTSGKDYEALLAAIKRLRGVTITTNVGSKRRNGRVVGLIESGEVIESDDRGRMLHIEIVLSDWIFSAINNKQVLTYNPKYYLLRKPNERRMYEICRKFCGDKPIWEIGFDKLYNRFGTRASEKEFRRYIREMVEAQNIPDYQLEWDRGRDMLIVYKVADPKMRLREDVD